MGILIWNETGEPLVVRKPPHVMVRTDMLDAARILVSQEFMFTKPNPFDFQVNADGDTYITFEVCGYKKRVWILGDYDFDRDCFEAQWLSITWADVYHESQQR